MINNKFPYTISSYEDSDIFNDLPLDFPKKGVSLYCFSLSTKSASYKINDPDRHLFLKELAARFCFFTRSCNENKASNATGDQQKNITFQELRRESKKMKSKIFFLLILFILCTSEALSISQSDESVPMIYNGDKARQAASGKIIRKRVRYEKTAYHPGENKFFSPPADAPIMPEDPFAELPEKIRKKLNPRELRFFPIVKSAADKYDVETSWIMAIIKTESDFDHKAVSSRGAIGLMQLMPRTASGLGIKNPFEPKKNVYGGTRYFADMVRRFGRMDLALAAYNAGPTLVKKLRRIPNLRQTRKYVAKVIRHQKKYSAIMPVLTSYYQPPETPAALPPSPLS